MAGDSGFVCGTSGYRDVVYEGELSYGLGEEERCQREGLNRIAISLLPKTGVDAEWEPFDIALSKKIKISYGQFSANIGEHLKTHRKFYFKKNEFKIFFYKPPPFQLLYHQPRARSNSVNYSPAIPSDRSLPLTQQTHTVSNPSSTSPPGLQAMSRRTFPHGGRSNPRAGEGGGRAVVWVKRGCWGGGVDVTIEKRDLKFFFRWGEEMKNVT